MFGGTEARSQEVCVWYMGEKARWTEPTGEGRELGTWPREGATAGCQDTTWAPVAGEEGVGGDGRGVQWKGSHGSV